MEEEQGVTELLSQAGCDVMTEGVTEDGDGPSFPDFFLVVVSRANANIDASTGCHSDPNTAERPASQ